MSRSDGAHVNQGPGPDAYDAGPYLPKRGGLPAHRRAAAECRGCPLYENATQTVFGKGATTARIVLVGEQPGDQEDKQEIKAVSADVSRHITTRRPETGWAEARR